MQKCMDLEKAYVKVNRKAPWEVLSLYGVQGRLLNTVNGSSACVSEGRSKWFEINVGVPQGHILSQRLFMLFMDGALCKVSGMLG